jgi:hypothetical protein
MWKWHDGVIGKGSGGLEDSEFVQAVAVLYFNQLCLWQVKCSQPFPCTDAPRLFRIYSSNGPSFFICPVLDYFAGNHPFLWILTKFIQTMSAHNGTLFFYCMLFSSSIHKRAFHKTRLVGVGKTGNGNLDGVHVAIFCRVLFFFRPGLQ